MEPITVKLNTGAKTVGRIVQFVTLYENDVLAVVVWNTGIITAERLVNLVTLTGIGLWPGERVTA